MVKQKSKMNKLSNQIDRLNDTDLLANFNINQERQIIADKIADGGHKNIAYIAKNIKRNSGLGYFSKIKKEFMPISQKDELKKSKKMKKKFSKKSNPYSNPSIKYKYSGNKKDVSINSIQQKLFGKNISRNSVSNFDISILDSEKISVFMEKRKIPSNSERNSLKGNSIISRKGLKSFESPYRDQESNQRKESMMFIKTPNRNLNQPLMFTPNKKHFISGKKHIEVDLFCKKSKRR